MNAMLQKLHFPSDQDLIKGRCTPVLFTPRPGSPERFVVAVAASDGRTFDVCAPERLDALECLFGSEAEIARIAIIAAVDGLTQHLAKGEPASSYVPSVSGISMGETRELTGTSIPQMARHLLRKTSTFAAREIVHEVSAPPSPEEAVAIERATGPDRLPRLVFEYVYERRPGLAEAFSDEVREPKLKQKARNSIVIAYRSSNLVANFASLQARRTANSRNFVKRLMWDLSQAKKERDRFECVTGAAFDMLIQYQDLDDPNITERQYEELIGEIDSLREEALRQDIGLVSKTSVRAIGEHILSLEAA
ncbi:hypothetical protein [Salinarimonas sp.]|uniref:hypothetical protein n=1 Tax=Salinarimonas sp. TaxID=2766526 RepID=UPI0032D901B2